MPNGVHEDCAYELAPRVCGFSFMSSIVSVCWLEVTPEGVLYEWKLLVLSVDLYENFFRVPRCIYMFIVF